MKRKSRKAKIIRKIEKFIIDNQVKIIILLYTGLFVLFMIGHIYSNGFSASGYK